MNWTIFWNPFKCYETKKMLVLGLVFFFIGSWLASQFDFTFDGVLDLHSVAKVNLVRALQENAINVALLSVLVFVVGIIINSRTRVVDVLNAVLIFRIPFYVAILFSSIPFVRKAQEGILENLKDLSHFQLEALQIITLLAFSLVILLLLTYAIILLFNGFKTATNAKTWQHYILFAVALLVAEIVSKILIQEF